MVKKGRGVRSAPITQIPERGGILSFEPNPIL